MATTQAFCVRPFTNTNKFSISKSFTVSQQRHGLRQAMVRVQRRCTPCATIVNIGAPPGAPGGGGPTGPGTMPPGGGAPGGGVPGGEAYPVPCCVLVSCAFYGLHVVYLLTTVFEHELGDFICLQTCLHMQVQHLSRRCQSHPLSLAQDSPM